MRSIGKVFGLFAVILVVNGLFAVSIVHGQAGVTTPVIPGFGVSCHEYSYYMSPTYGVDPLTGKAVMTHDGYYKIVRQVEVSIINQPFKRYNDSYGNHIEIFLEVRCKPSDSDDWKSFPLAFIILKRLIFP